MRSSARTTCSVPGRRFAVWFVRKYPGLAARLHISSGGNGNGGSNGKGAKREAA